MGGGSWNGSGDIPVASVCMVQGEPGLGLGRQSNDQWRRHHQGREERPPGVPPLEGRRRRQGIFPAREPAAHAVRPEAARRRIARSTTSTKPSTGTKTRTTPSSSCWRPTASTICTTARTAAMPATRIPAVRKMWPSRSESKPEREIVRRPGHVRDGREPERDRDEHEGSARCPLRRRITAGADLDPLIPHWNWGAAPPGSHRRDGRRRRPRKNGRRRRLPPDAGRGGSPRPPGGIAGVNDTVQIVENWSRILRPGRGLEAAAQIRRTGHLDDRRGARRGRRLVRRIASPQSAGWRRGYDDPRDRARERSDAGRAAEGFDGRRGGAARWVARAGLREPRPHHADARVTARSHRSRPP